MRCKIMNKYIIVFCILLNAKISIKELIRCLQLHYHIIKYSISKGIKYGMFSATSEF